MSVTPNTISLTQVAFFAKKGATAANLDVCLTQRGSDCDERDIPRSCSRRAGVTRKRSKRGLARVRSVALLWCLLFGLPLGASPAAAARPGSIVLVGDRSAMSEIVLRAPVTVHEIGAKVEFSGTYAGWYIHRAQETFESTPEGTAGGYVVKDFQPSHYPPSPFPLGAEIDPTLEPGRYRLYLFTDGPARITIQADGLGRRIVVRPKRATRSYAAAEELPLELGMAGTAQGRFPVEIRDNTMALSMVAHYSKRGATVGNIGACFTDPGTSCTRGFGGPLVSFAVVPEDWGFALTVLYYPGVFAPGRYDGVQVFDGGGTVYSLRGAVLLLDLHIGP